MTMMRLSVLSMLLSLGLACGGGSKDTETTPGDTTGGDTAGGDMAGGDTAGGDTAGGDTAGGDTAGGDTATPAGPSAADQVAQGEKVYGDSCATCHGAAGEGKGKKSPAVVGPKALTKYKNAADLEKYIKEKMPKDDPGSLSEADSWAVTAWIVSKQGKLGDAALSADNAAGIALQ
jgi:mono/diheme cytochrome c family protein